jgi:hypothetical protein
MSSIGSIHDHAGNLKTPFFGFSNSQPETGPLSTGSLNNGHYTHVQMLQKGYSPTHFLYN